MTERTAVNTVSTTFRGPCSFANGTVALMLAAGAVLFSGVAVSEPVRTPHTSVELVAEVESFVPGETFDVGLRLTPDPGWHTYWINPGDAGKAAELDWDLSEGISVTDLQFPAPGFIPFMGLLSYGYNEETLLIATVSTPEQAGDSIALSAFANWLVCDDKICIPESADVFLNLPRGAGSYDPLTRTAFAKARALHPVAVDWPAEFRSSAERVEFRFNMAHPEQASQWRKSHVFPVAEKLIDHAAPQEVSVDGPFLTVSTAAGYRHDRFESTGAVLRFEGADGRVQAFLFDAVRTSDFSVVSEANTTSSAFFTDSDSSLASTSSNLDAASAAFSWIPFLRALLFAVLGGFILNLMPCVLPILSLKALSVSEMAKLSKRDSQQSGLMYAAGVLCCFLAFAAILLSLRAAGDLAGWAFHLQNPLVVSVLALIMVAIGLNFVGVFELRGTASNLGIVNKLLSGHNNESFFTGLLAVVVASPCTVPFMAGALGYALVQPMVVTLAIFVGLGIGFALPFLAVSFVPAVHGLLPKPGAWMNSMRQVLAFPMLATALWLFWIVGRLAGVDSLAMTLLATLALAFALWCWGVAQQRPLWRWRIPGWSAVVVCALALYGSTASTAPQGIEADVSGEPWSEQRVAELRAADRPVFAYFTADWCITCKVNERVAINTDSVQEFFRNNDVAVLVGDWTNEDPDISAELERRGRAGVPVYLYWPPGGLDEPLMLPSLLTPKIVMHALADAGFE